MITPKEKAKELYEKFFYTIPSISDKGQLEHETSKQCALIAVDEILSDMGADRGYEFWSNVKNEIKNL